MPAQTSASCPVDRRFRSLTAMTTADIRHAAIALSRRPDSLHLREALKEVQRNKEHQTEAAVSHRASCDLCFESGVLL